MRDMAAVRTVKVFEVSGPGGLAECLRLRRKVFVEEQGVSLEEEMDGLDPFCRHFLAGRHGELLGAGRLKPIEAGVKIQRVAVLADARGIGVGRILMEAMIAAAKGERVILDSQVSALGFYERLRFEAIGDEFLDAGIPHRRMVYSPGA